MYVKCEKCNKVYNDFDHLTYCPHEGFASSPSYDELVSKGKAPKYDTRASPDLTDCNSNYVGSKTKTRN